MAFREKIAWLTLGAMLVAYGVYFSLLAMAAQGGEPPLLRMLGLFAAVTVGQVVFVIIASVVLATQSRGEAQAPPDERDRAIARRGTSVAYFVLMVGMILVGVVMPFGAPGWKIINAALFALVVAESVRYGLVVISYRRGWHG
jgi:hypothetical protein